MIIPLPGTQSSLCRLGFCTVHRYVRATLLQHTPFLCNFHLLAFTLFTLFFFPEAAAAAADVLSDAANTALTPEHLRAQEKAAGRSRLTRDYRRTNGHTAMLQDFSST